MDPEIVVTWSQPVSNCQATQACLWSDFILFLLRASSRALLLALLLFFSTFFFLHGINSIASRYRRERWKRDEIERLWSMPALQKIEKIEKIGSLPPGRDSTLMSVASAVWSVVWETVDWKQRSRVNPAIRSVSPGDHAAPIFDIESQLHRVAGHVLLPSPDHRPGDNNFQGFFIRIFHTTKKLGYETNFP